MSAGGYNPVYDINWRFFNQQDEKFWYFAGLVASDGYISEKKISISLQSKDRLILEKIKELIQPDKNLYKSEKKNQHRLTIHNIKLAKYMKEIFSMETNNKGKELRFPKNIPNQYIKDFIRGVFDGDGCIDKTKGQQTVDGQKVYYIGLRVRLFLNKDFLQELNEQFRNHYSHRTNAIRKKSGADIHVVTYNFSTAEAFMNWIYDTNSNLYMIRKRNKYNKLYKKYVS